MKLSIQSLLIAVAAVCLFANSTAAADSVLIKNVNVFDGESRDIAAGVSVLIVGNRITAVGKDLDVPDDATRIDGGDRFLMPGMIDGHAHLSVIAAPRELQDLHWAEIGAKMAVRAERTLMHGFTTVRDLGGPVFGLKSAVDAGAVVGPRIFPSGAFITQTSGHGDFRKPMDPHPFLDGGSSQMQELGYYRIVDGPDQVLAAVRENLRSGATQVKLMGSGGVGSDFDPIDSVQFRPEEIRAATAALADWGTYAGSHLHNDASIRRALENGVLSIDHASQMTDASMRLLKQKGAYMNPQFGWNKVIYAAGFLTEFQLEKAAIVLDNVENNIRLIRKHDIQITFNIDAFGPYELWRAVTAAEFSEREKYFSAYEILRQATSVTAGLVEMSGKRNPYRGKLGVIREGALADLLIVDGDPMQDITVLADAETNIRLIMKDGKVFKNTLD
jgi:imidazolonepropionase-like amidohydrolase